MAVSTGRCGHQPALSAQLVPRPNGNRCSLPPPQCAPLPVPWPVHTLRRRTTCALRSASTRSILLSRMRSAKATCSTACSCQKQAWMGLRQDTRRPRQTRRGAGEAGERGGQRQKRRPASMQACKQARTSFSAPSAIWLSSRCCRMWAASTTVRIASSRTRSCKGRGGEGGLQPGSCPLLGTALALEELGRHIRGTPAPPLPRRTLSSSSTRKVWATGAGSARPVVSIRIASNLRGSRATGLMGLSADSWDAGAA